MSTLVTNKDFDLKFTKTSNGDVRIRADKPDRNLFPSIEQSISNILLTGTGEKPFNPNFGGNIYSYLFEHFPDFEAMTVPEEINIKEQIKYSIRQFEPRVIVEEISLGKDLGVYRNRVDQNRLQVVVYYRIPPRDETYEYTLNLKRVR